MTSQRQLGFFDPALLPAPKPPRMARRLSVLITVKAAPNPSSTYGETVCVAGISTDLAEPGWVRLYPINFRDLSSDGQFQKYDLIEVDANPATADPRTESWKPIMTTMTRTAHLPPWAKRRELVDPYVETSMCAINAGSLLPGSPSLAAIQVADVSDFVVTPHPGWSQAEQEKIDSYVNQLDLFGSNDRTALEAPPLPRQVPLALRGSRVQGPRARPARLGVRCAATELVRQVGRRDQSVAPPALLGRDLRIRQGPRVLRRQPSQAAQRVQRARCVLPEGAVARRDLINDHLAVAALLVALEAQNRDNLLSGDGTQSLKVAPRVVGRQKRPEGVAALLHLIAGKDRAVFSRVAEAS